jgi:hypothetical protein
VFRIGIQIRVGTAFGGRLDPYPVNIERVKNERKNTKQDRYQAK